MTRGREGAVGESSYGKGRTKVAVTVTERNGAFHSVEFGVSRVKGQ